MLNINLSGNINHLGERWIIEWLNCYRSVTLLSMPATLSCDDSVHPRGRSSLNRNLSKLARIPLSQSLSISRRERKTRRKTLIVSCHAGNDLSSCDVNNKLFRRMRIHLDPSSCDLRCMYNKYRRTRSRKYHRVISNSYETAYPFFWWFFMNSADFTILIYMS